MEDCRGYGRAQAQRHRWSTLHRPTWTGSPKCPQCHYVLANPTIYGKVVNGNDRTLAVAEHIQAHHDGDDESRDVILQIKAHIVVKRDIGKHSQEDNDWFANQLSADLEIVYWENEDWQDDEYHTAFTVVKFGDTLENQRDVRRQRLGLMRIQTNSSFLSSG